MFYRISSLTLFPGEEESLLYKKASRELGVSPSVIKEIRLFRKSLDARKSRIVFHYTVDVYLREKALVSPSEKCKRIENEFSYKIPTLKTVEKRPVVVGFGPSGMFAALLLARAGLCPIVLEKGKKIEEREKDVDLFFREGKLSVSSNIQFGEGGAGTFSDGKLNTLLKDKNFRGRFVLEEFVRFGAPEEILYLNKPHIGTDRLRKVVRLLREEIISLGGEVLFESEFISPVIKNNKIVGVTYLQKGEEKEILCDTVFLGIGHSARETFRHLRNSGILMEKKIFSVGVRIEHLQEKINQTQYGSFVGGNLPSADYKLAVPTSFGKNLYTFCMCPGGVVVPATSEEGGVVTNGMSYFARDGKNANSALLLNVLPDELPEDIFSGFAFQRKLEENAFIAGGKNFKAPCQLVGDFLNQKESTAFGEVLPSYSLGVQLTSLESVLPSNLSEPLREGIIKMGEIFKGFSAEDALLTGVESRATSPVRILRGEDFQSSIFGLYPIGEGAGYAGGIMSSAMDGMKAVEAFFNKLEENA